MSAAEAATSLETEVKPGLRILRNAVFRCADNAVNLADVLHQRVGLLAARVDLLAAIAAVTGDAPDSSTQLDMAARRVQEFRPSDPEVLLELVTALFVADQDPKAIAATLKALRTGQADYPEPDTVTAALRYLLHTGHAHQAKRLLDALLPTAQSIPSWRKATVGTGVAITEPSPFARQLLAATLSASEDELVRAPDNLALRRVHAFALIELGQRERGLQETQEILRQDPSDGETGWTEVITLTQLGRNEQALAELNRLTEPISLVPAVHALRVRLLLAAGQPDAAMRAAIDGARLHPEQLDVRLALVDALDAMGRRDEAQQQMDELLQKNPDNSVLLTVLGNLQHGAGELASATETLRHAVQAEPDDPDARIALAGALSDNGDWEGALAHLDAALQSHPERADILLERVRVLRSSGSLVEALQSLEGLPQGAYEATWELRGDLLLQLNRETEAISWYARCLTSAQDTGDAQRFAEALERTADRLYSQDRFSEALEALAPVRQAGLLSLEAMGLRSELLRMTEQWHESLAQADESLALGFEAAWVRGTKAATLVTLGRSQEALDVLVTALEASPDYLFGQSFRIAALDELGRVTEAQQVLEEHFPVEADQEQTWRVWATMARSQVLIDAARYEDAVRILKEALQGQDDEASWYAPLAVAYSRLGKPRRAVDTMRRALTALNDNVAEWAWVELADGLTFMRHGTDAEANEIYRRLASKPDQGSAPKDVALRAWCLLRLGDFDGAIARYRAAIDAAKDPLLNERFRLGIALVLAGVDDREKGILDRVLADIAALSDRAAANGLASEASHVIDLLQNDNRYAARREELDQVRGRLPTSLLLTPT